MTFSGLLQRSTIVGGLALALALTTGAPSARANVYASNVKINGTVSNLSVAQGASVKISYILNEPASAGVTVKILSGANPVRTISIAGGSTGATRGTNTVVWDGKNDGNVSVPTGNYAVSITAASPGYNGWTITSDDNNDGNYVWEARGIAVNRNTNSPYYGRVFVGNSATGPGSLYGDLVGIQKLNADGSYADEGGFSAGGVAWRDGGFAPWKIRVADDDNVYIEDWYGNGDVYRFDPLISSNSMLHVFSADNNAVTNYLSGMAIVGGGTNTQIWMTDSTYPGSVGILKYAVTADGTCATNDTGAPVVGVGGSLDNAPYDVALDKGGNIYTVQNLFDPGNPAVRVLCFPAYDPSTNGGAPELSATWAVGAGDDTYAGTHGLAVDPTGTYVAVACWGFSLPSGGYINGSTTIFYATNGAVVTNVDLGVSIPSSLTTNLVLDPTHHVDTDCAWDAAGNLYYLDNGPGVWRAVSPPGSNQATTVALPIVQVTSSAQAPVITSIEVAAGMVTIRFTSGSGDTAGGFVLLSASVAQGPYSPAAGATITQLGPGLFQATVPVSNSPQYYRIERSSTVPLHITNLRVAGGTVTIDFTGATSDSPSALTLLSSASANGSYTAAAGATIIQVSPGLFQATVPANGPMQFYRIERSGTVPLHITNLRVAGGTVTIDFTGATSDSPSAFTLLSSGSASGSYSAAAGATIIQVSPGLFQATVPTNGPIQFYRIRK
jgi:hypothetical protein